MKSKDKLFRLIGALLCFVTLSACVRINTYPSGGPHYYKSWASYKMPYRPAGQITEIQANQLADQGYAYHIAHFDAEGRLKTFEKKYKGQREWKVEYVYDGNNIKETRIKKDGSKTVKTYKK